MANLNDDRSLAAALALGGALGVRLPDSKAVARAYAQAQEVSEPWLFHHVVRSWLYASVLAKKRVIEVDAELVGVAVLLHDMGLAKGGSPGRRFEVIGADHGRDFARDVGMGPIRADTVWDAIALHTTASIAQHKGVDVACCQSGISCDYAGLGYDQLNDEQKTAILHKYPRLKMKESLTTCLVGIAEKHPATTLDNFLADFGVRYVPSYKKPSSVDYLHNAPFPE